MGNNTLCTMIADGHVKEGRNWTFQHFREDASYKRNCYNYNVLLLKCCRETLYHFIYYSKCVHIWQPYNGINIYRYTVNNILISFQLRFYAYEIVKLKLPNCYIYSERLFVTMKREWIIYGYGYVSPKLVVRKFYVCSKLTTKESVNTVSDYIRGAFFLLLKMWRGV